MTDCGQPCTIMPVLPKVRFRGEMAEICPALDEPQAEIRDDRFEAP
jgi:hypothetical protein